MLAKQLQQLGLAEKESRVYLAALELGSSTVQDIARKAGVNRPTTYVQIEFLAKKGLISTVIRGKKRFFNAESPEQLIRLLDKKKKDIESQKEEFEKYLPELKTLYNLAEEKPKVRFFEGIEGVRTIQQDLLKSDIKEIYNFVPLDDAYEVSPPGPDDNRKAMDRKLENAKVKVLYSTRKEERLKSDRERKEYKYISPDKISFRTEISIYNNKVVLINYKTKLLGVIIEDVEISNSLKGLFNLAWKAV